MDNGGLDTLSGGVMPTTPQLENGTESTMQVVLQLVALNPISAKELFAISEFRSPRWQSKSGSRGSWPGRTGCAGCGEPRG